jgi:hypothetical protein
MRVCRCLLGSANALIFTIPPPVFAIANGAAIRGDAASAMTGEATATAPATAMVKGNFIL